jgi:hypothetical protein
MTTNADIYVSTLQTIIDTCYDGKLPAPQDDAKFLARFVKDIPANMPEVAAETFDGFRHALATLRAARKTQWAN